MGSSGETDRNSELWIHSQVSCHCTFLTPTPSAEETGAANSFLVVATASGTRSSLRAASRLPAAVQGCARETPPHGGRCNVKDEEAAAGPAGQHHRPRLHHD